VENHGHPVPQAGASRGTRPPTRFAVVKGGGRADPPCRIVGQRDVKTLRELRHRGAWGGDGFVESIQWRQRTTCANEGSFEGKAAARTHAITHEPVGDTGVKGCATLHVKASARTPSWPIRDSSPSRPRTPSSSDAEVLIATGCRARRTKPTANEGGRHRCDTRPMPVVIGLRESRPANHRRDAAGATELVEFLGQGKAAGWGPGDMAQGPRG